MRPRETPDLQRWRETSRHIVGTAHGAADLFTDFLAAGGPDAIKSLQATIRKLQAQLEEQKAEGRLERYRKLQKDLEECDKVRASLRTALVSCHWAEEEIDAHIQKKLFKANTLYGASREMLLRENRLLRAQLEEHVVTSRTSRPIGASPLGGRVAAPESKLKQARLMLGPHMESVAALRDAADALDAAERFFKLPSVRHAETQADDGSVRLIATLQQQLGVVAGQKLALMQQVASLMEQASVTDMKLEGALDQVAELRRQKTDMLAHQDNLSKDLREHLLSEAKRADSAETALAEAKLAVATAREAEVAAVKDMERALAEAQAMQAALQEKEQQVDTLRGLYLELRETLERLAGDVTSGQQEAARRLLDATREQFLDQRALLEDVKGATLETHRAAQQSTGRVVELAAQQRVLVAEVMQSGQAAVQTLGAYERQLAVTQALLQQSEADRVRLARQAIAASALNRLEGKRHEKTVGLLLHEVPQSVAQRLAPGLQALAEGTAQLAEELENTNNTLAEAGVLPGAGGGRRTEDMLHSPMVPDEVDDATSQLLANSRHLRAQLLNLTPGGGGSAAVALRPGGGDVGGDLWAGPNAGGGLSSPQELRELPLGAAFAGGAYGGGGGSRAPALELMAAAPLPAHVPGPPFAVGPPPVLLTPTGHPYVPAAAAAFEPGALMFPPEFTAAAAYAAATAGVHHPSGLPGYVLQGPPARLDLVLQLPPEEPQPQRQPYGQQQAAHHDEQQPLQGGEGGTPSAAPSAQQLLQPQQQQHPPLGSGQQRVDSTGQGGAPDEAAAGRAPAAHEPGAASQTGAGVEPAPPSASGGGGAGAASGGAVVELAPARVVATEVGTAGRAGQQTVDARLEAKGGLGAGATPEVPAAGGKEEEARAAAGGSGGNPAATVWVPSPALLEAFKDMAL